MTRAAGFTGTILIVAGFLATAIAAPSEARDDDDAERCERLGERLATIDHGFAADIEAGQAPAAADAGAFVVEIVACENAV